MTVTPPTPPASPIPSQWARKWPTARPFAKPAPRAGAWYPVVGETSNDRAVLEIGGKRVAIARKYLEIRDKRPETFTAVTRTRDSISVLKRRGMEMPRTYAVCPRCMHRVDAFPGQSQAHCRRCGHGGEIAWWETG